MTRSCEFPLTWHTKQTWISFVSFEFELPTMGVDVRRELALGGLSIPDERRVRTGGDLDLFGSFCGVPTGDDTVDGGGDFDVY